MKKTKRKVIDRRDWLFMEKVAYFDFKQDVGELIRKPMWYIKLYCFISKVHGKFWEFWYYNPIYNYFYERKK